MNGWKVSALALSMAAMGYAQQNFNMYGFLDFQIQKRSMTESNNILLQESFLNENLDMNLTSLNLYFDFVPNDRTRALVEIDFATSPGDEGAEVANTLGVVKVEKMDLPPEGVGATIVDTMTVMGLNAAADQVMQGQEKARKEANPQSRGGKKYYGVNVERAWVDFTLSEGYKLKAGKFITPAGIWAVDHGSPVITTVAQPNQTDFFPIFPKRQVGLMLTGNEFLGDHDIVFNGFVSTGRQDIGIGSDGSKNEIQELDDLGYGGKVAMNLDMLDGVHFGVSGFGGTMKRENRVYNINSIIPAADFAGLVTSDDPDKAIEDYIKENVDFGANDYSVTTTQKLYDVAYGAELKVDYSGFSLQGEVNGRQVIDELNDDKTMTYLAWYGLLSYTSFLTDDISLTPYGLIENISWEDAENSPIGGLNTIPMDGWTQYALGLNFGFYNNYRLKLEYSYSELFVNNDLFPTSTVKQGDLDISTYSAQITVAF